MEKMTRTTKLEDSNLNVKATSTSSNQKTKRAYKKPELLSHGSLSELTKFGGSNRAFDFFARRF